MASSYRVLIAGGGVAGGYSAAELVKKGIKKGDVALLSAEAVCPFVSSPMTAPLLT